MSLIEMSHQHRPTPTRATFALDFNAEDDNDDDDGTSAPTDRHQTSDVGGARSATEQHFTPTRRFSDCMLSEVLDPAA